MSYLKGILDDLREKRLWPVAVGLLAALVAIPVLLSAKAKSVPAPPQPPTGAAAPLASALPAVSVSTTQVQSRLRGPSRDPFAQQHVLITKAVAGSSTPTATASGGTTTASTAVPGASTPTTATASGGTGSAGSGSTSTSSTPPVTSPTVPAKPAPTGLTASQSYNVTFVITNAAGGLDTSDSLERLSVLPSERQPLLVELGVLEGGHRVLFAVQPGAAVSGPGTCTPGPIDCEILSVAQDQIETLSVRSRTGISELAQFAVTAIKTEQHPSTAAADKARRTASDAGRRLLSQSPTGALSLFQYEPSMGAVVDLRNLTVGGS